MWPPSFGENKKIKFQLVSMETLFNSENPILKHSSGSSLRFSDSRQLFGSVPKAPVILKIVHKTSDDTYIGTLKKSDREGNPELDLPFFLQNSKFFHRLS